MEVWGGSATCAGCGVQARVDGAAKGNVSKCPLWRPVGWGEHGPGAAQWMREAQRLSLAWSEAGRRTERLQTQQAIAVALLGSRGEPGASSDGAGAGAPAARPGAPGGPPLRLVPYRGHEVAEHGAFRICVGCGLTPPKALRARQAWMRLKCPGPPEVVLPKVLGIATGPLAEVLRPGGAHGDRAAWMFA